MHCLHVLFPLCHLTLLPNIVTKQLLQPDGYKCCFLWVFYILSGPFEKDSQWLFLLLSLLSLMSRKHVL